MQNCLKRNMLHRSKTIDSSFNSPDNAYISKNGVKVVYKPFSVLSMHKLNTLKPLILKEKNQFRHVFVPEPIKKGRISINYFLFRVYSYYGHVAGEYTQS